MYNSTQDKWSLKEYKADDTSTLLYEGQGKPVAYDYSMNTYGETFKDFAMQVNTNFQFECIKKETLNTIASSCLGCFEIDADTRHFGFLKDKVILGLGLRISPKGIESGDYQENFLQK